MSFYIDFYSILTIFSSKNYIKEIKFLFQLKMESKIKTPIKFSQPSESTPAKTILVHISKMESFICSLNPAASLYEDVTNEEDIRACYNELGEYLEHIDNGTDYVMVRRNNGEVQNLVSFSYSPDNVNNRNMLSNVASYYAQKVGLNQNIDVLDNPKGGESAMFATIARHVSMVVNNGSINSDANTSNNIMNALVHEYDHVKKGTSGAIAEIEAIAKAVTHQTWVNTTESYKQATMQYLVDNANAATRPVFTVIEPIISRLEAFGLILNYNQGANVYSWEILIPEFVITAPRRQ